MMEGQNKTLMLAGYGCTDAWNWLANRVLMLACYGCIKREKQRAKLAKHNKEWHLMIPHPLLSSLLPMPYPLPAKHSKEWHPIIPHPLVTSLLPMSYPHPAVMLVIHIKQLLRGSFPMSASAVSHPPLAIHVYIVNWTYVITAYMGSTCTIDVYPCLSVSCDDSLHGKHLHHWRLSAGLDLSCDGSLQVQHLHKWTKSFLSCSMLNL